VYATSEQCGHLRDVSSCVRSADQMLSTVIQTLGRLVIGVTHEHGSAVCSSLKMIINFSHSLITSN
jgi:hypothetical protein